ncbi:TPA: DUF3696 domain-containing protein [Vibrio vulnificus]|uniref:AAA family ATPase n=1 Tax=Vibrio TaxID=662 RepID=UPI00054419B2|nr:MULTISPECIES: DUF3696 domain-containing protein [Vibrio]KHF86002.1 hypothetical protein OA19_12360 [Vibrio vulnificus]KHF90526.1 hypothetical protein OA16_12620 [Vibrio vulnificus]RZR26799.1 DUF3696 domain-containing protein [Vibrio vulnificus]TXZ56810.1 DUF3696 domain-containing protein [Vibrio cholerae]GHW15067.1 hypothetical protein VCSRO54_2993 [Vibrio cholerae]
MIKKLDLTNFKCFKRLVLPLSNLTALTGFNASGKTSTIQSILLLSQNLKNTRQDEKISLNGTLVRLGSPGDVLYENSNEKLIKIDIENEEEKISVSLDLSKRNTDRTIDIGDLSLAGRGSTFSCRSSSVLFSKIIEVQSPLFTSIRNIVYLSTGRQDLDTLYPTSLNNSEFNVGEKGEFAPWLFDISKDDVVSYSKRHPSEPADSFRRQFNAWFGDIFQGAEADTLLIDNSNFVRLLFRHNNTSEWRNPSNIGYGLSYAFPIVVSALLAKPGDILVIDSPEAHLHPQGQSKMGEFLSIISNSGVQVIIETHSDHVINGLRLAVSRSLVESEKVGLHFFNSKSENIISPSIDSSGRVSEWPEGFFDQAEKDLAELSGW